MNKININKIESENKTQPNPDTEEEFEQKNSKSYNKDEEFANIIQKLLDENIESALEKLKLHLKYINEEKYLYLINNLIKLSILKQDSTFTDPITALIYINRNRYKFDIIDYVQKFYITISKNNLEESKIYLDIIKKYNLLKDSEIKITTLENLYELTMENQENIKISDMYNQKNMEKSDQTLQKKI